MTRRRNAHAQVVTCQLFFLSGSRERYRRPAGSCMPPSAYTACCPCSCSDIALQHTSREGRSLGASILPEARCHGNYCMYRYTIVVVPGRIIFQVSPSPLSECTLKDHSVDCAKEGSQKGSHLKSRSIPTATCHVHYYLLTCTLSLLMYGVRNHGVRYTTKEGALMKDPSPNGVAHHTSFGMLRPYRVSVGTAVCVLLWECTA